MDDLLPTLLAEHQPASTLERHLTHQLAHVLAKQATAEDNETHLLGKQPQYLLTHRPDGHLVPDPAYLLYNNRLDAMRLHQARLGREQSRVLRELHRLKRTPLAVKAADEPSVANQNAAGEPKLAASVPATEPKLAASGLASEPSAASAGAATEPTAPPPASPRLDRGVNGHGANAAHPDPWTARSSRAKAEMMRPVDRANEPKKPAHAWPVLSDAEADRIEAMIASGDIGQLEEAARLLGIMDGNAPVPPHILALAQSKLAG